MTVIQKTFTDSDGTRKVEIFQRDDNTLGFEEMKFGRDENAWYPVSKYSHAIVDSLDRAIKEATERVVWLSVKK